MKNDLPTFARRRLFAMLFLTLLGFAAGFAWGHWYGYRQGKNDIMKQVEQRLNTAPTVPRI